MANWLATSRPTPFRVLEASLAGVFVANLWPSYQKCYEMQRLRINGLNLVKHSFLAIQNVSNVFGAFHIFIAWGARGRKFESCRPDQYLPDDDGTSVVPFVVPIGSDAFEGDSLGQDEQGFLGGNLECPDLDERRADESLYGGGRCIADAQPDDFWWRTVHQRQAPKIIVLGDDREIVLARSRA